MAEFSYHLIRRQRRTISVEVRPDATIVVRAPCKAPISEIERFLQLKAPWVIGRLQDAEARRMSIPQRTEPHHLYHRGEVLLWGWQNADIIVPQRYTTAQAALRWVERWQRSEAASLFGQYLRKDLPAIGLSALRYQGLTLRRMRRRWGSCASTGHITLNEHLIRVPEACIRSVIVHEICHLAHLHHGPAFHALVADVFPDHRIADAVLDVWTSVLYAEETAKKIHT